MENQSGQLPEHVLGAGRTWTSCICHINILLDVQGLRILKDEKHSGSFHTSFTKGRKGLLPFRTIFKRRAMGEERPSTTLMLIPRATIVPGPVLRSFFFFFF